MRARCPHCEQYTGQPVNAEGPNFCPRCQKLFYVPEDPPVPTWILGILVILVANWQIMLH